MRDRSRVPTSEMQPGPLRGSAEDRLPSALASPQKLQGNDSKGVKSAQPRPGREKSPERPGRGIRPGAASQHWQSPGRPEGLLHPPTSPSPTGRPLTAEAAAEMGETRPGGWRESRPLLRRQAAGAGRRPWAGTLGKGVQGGRPGVLPGLRAPLSGAAPPWPQTPRCSQEADGSLRPRVISSVLTRMGSFSLWLAPNFTAMSRSA